MGKFKGGDIVHCPTLSDEPFTLYTKENKEGVFLSYDNREFWFSLDGVNMNFTNTDYFGYSTYPKLFFQEDLPQEKIFN